MPALQNKSYFNYGGQGPLPEPSLKAITTSWLKIQELGPFASKVWPYVASEIQSTRLMLANICGVTPNRIALTENVTTGCVLPLWGLPFKPGERILISDCEHPGIVAACRELARRHQLGIDILPVKQLREGFSNRSETKASVLTSFEQYLSPKTRLVVVSHILWNTGQLIPIKAIADLLEEHPQKPFLLVDAAQSFGQLPIGSEASSADIFAFTGHKWACGPEGLGAVVLSERVLSKASPTIIGWKSLQHEGSFKQNANLNCYNDSRRFEVATSCVPLLAGLRCSLELLEQEGTNKERIKKIRHFSSEVWEELKNLKGLDPILNGYPPAGLVSFSLTNKDQSKETVKCLSRLGVCIRDLEDPVCLRACFHITTNNKDMKALKEALISISK